MDRRVMLTGVTTLVAAGLTTQASAADEHAHHGAAHRHQTLLDAVSNCLTTGQICHQHCLELLGKGEKEMAACAASVTEMLAACAALQQLATHKSKHLGKMARVALDVCKECEAECRKHAAKHQPCKDCGEACVACIKECEKLAA